MKRKIKRLLSKISKKSTAFRTFYHSLFTGYKKMRYKRYTKPFQTDGKTILFQSYFGRSYSCSPRAIYEAMLADPQYDEYTFVWAFRRPKSKNLQVFPDLRRAVLVRYASWEHLQYFAKAKYWVSNSRMPPEIVKKPDQVYIQTWHGTPLKRLAHNIQIQTRHAMTTTKELQRMYTTEAKLFDYLITQSPFCSEQLIKSFDLPGIQKENTVLEVGYPRNDFLTNHTLWDKRQIKQKLGIPGDKKVILYAPTWRDNQHVAGKGYIYETGKEFDVLYQHLSPDYIILFRAHYFIANSFDFTRYAGFVYDVSGAEEINELYIASDLLITDYSSVFFDYTNLGKPILFYMYDIKDYAENLRGFTLPFDQFPGPCIEDIASLAEAIRDIDRVAEEYRGRYQAFHARFNSLDDGKAAERAIEAFTGRPYARKEPRYSGIVLANVSADTLTHSEALRLKQARRRGKFLIACLPDGAPQAQRDVYEAVRYVDLVVTGQSPAQTQAHIEQYKVETVILERPASPPG